MAENEPEIYRQIKGAQIEDTLAHAGLLGYDATPLNNSGYDGGYSDAGGYAGGRSDAGGYDTGISDFSSYDGGGSDAGAGY